MVEPSTKKFCLRHWLLAPVIHCVQSQIKNFSHGSHAHPVVMRIFFSTAAFTEIETRRVYKVVSNVCIERLGSLSAVQNKRGTAMSIWFNHEAFSHRKLS